jgi:hypothetical protein
MITAKEIEQSRQQALRRLEATVSALITGPGAISDLEVVKIVNDTIQRIRGEERERAERAARRLADDKETPRDAPPGMREFLDLAGMKL